MRRKISTGREFAQVAVLHLAESRLYSARSSLTFQGWQTSIWPDRAARAQKIVENAALYKICEGCDSIVAARVTACPNCHGYRFNDSTEEVISQAHALASRPQTSVTAHDLE
jgi:hypothetical protein